jgi:signal transduction histidine kinase
MVLSLNALQVQTITLLNRVKTIGHTEEMGDYEKRKLSVFNQLNLYGLFSGIVTPILGLFDSPLITLSQFIVVLLPAIVSYYVLKLNNQGKFEQAKLVYFTLYPIVTTFIFVSGLNLGIELFFLLYGVLSVFYLPRPIYAIFSFALSAGCYTIVFLFKARYNNDLHIPNFLFYVVNHLLAIIFIFFALFWIRKENMGYQFSILKKNRLLHRHNLEIESQKLEIDHKRFLLEQQTAQLTELNSLKNKLFSVIAHDLKGPIYAQRNLLKNMLQYDVPGEEIKLLVPDILNDMNYTINLMDNLLQWAKCQMQADAIRPQQVDINELIDNVTKVLRLQAEAKQIHLNSKIKQGVFVFADRDMINLVLRNLLSNAIKFTPEKGCVDVEVNEDEAFVEILVKDTGRGMKPDELEKLFSEDYYTTKGTSNETGTGLGLMLCKEFLQKNGSSMKIQSRFGHGSTFSFRLPKQ